MVYNVHEKKDPISGATKPDGRGRSSTKSISEEDRNRIIDHVSLSQIDATDVKK